MELLMRKINKLFYISVDAADVFAYVKVNIVVVIIYMYVVWSAAANIQAIYNKERKRKKSMNEI